MSKVSTITIIDDEWFAEQYITETFALCEHYNVVLHPAPWNTILAAEVTAAFLPTLGKN